MWIRKLPWIVSGIFAAYLAAAVAGVPSSGRGFDLAEFGRLPVVMSGGVHAMDTAARISLRRIRGTDRIPLEPRTLANLWRAPRELSATEWLLEVLTLPDADTRQVFAVRDRSLATTLGLHGPAGNDVYHSFAELQASLPKIAKEAKRIEALDPPARAGWERECLELRNAVVVYTRLRTALQPNGLEPGEKRGKVDFAARLARYQDDLKPLADANRARERGARPALDPSAATAIRTFAAPFAAVSRTGFLALVPPADRSRSDDAWQTVGAAIADSTKDGRLRPAVAAYARVSSAYESGQVEAFNREVAKYRQWLRARGFGREAARARAEFAYYRAQPFTRAAAVYFAAFVLMCIPAFRRHADMRRCAMVLVCGAVLLHAVGLLWLMVIARGLPPMNLYIVALTAGLGVAAIAAAAAFGRRLPLAAAPAAALIAMAVAQGSVAGALQLARDAADLPFVLALAASLLLLGLALTDDGVLRIAIRRSSLANQPSA